MAPRRRRVRRRRAAVGARRDRVPDLERADSVTVDPHKWFFQAYDIGGLLVRDGAHLGQAFGGRAPEYYRGGEATGAAARPTTHDDHGDQLNFYKLSFEGTRRWRALKLWMSWKHLGTDGFGRLIEANDDLAALPRPPLRRVRRLRGASRRCPELSVVCFRHLPGGRARGAGAARRRARRPPGSTPGALEASGDGWLTTTRLRGATWLRAGIVNYLSTEDDIDRLLATLRRLAAGRPEAEPRVSRRRRAAGPRPRSRAGGSRRALARRRRQQDLRRPGPAVARSPAPMAARAAVGIAAG